jgi:hypothetical protein
MIIPDIEECPCCKALTWTRTEYGGKNILAYPVCDQDHDANDNLISHKLHWRCAVCGCEWKHGQFEKA